MITRVCGRRISTFHGENIARHFSHSNVAGINPFMPLDPNEILSGMEDDKLKKEQTNATKIQGRTKGNLNSTKKLSDSESPRDDNERSDEQRKSRKHKKKSDTWSHWGSVFRKCVETGLITLSSLVVLVLGGVAYHKLYKLNVLRKLRDSFNTKDSLLLAKHEYDHELTTDGLWAERPNQGLIDTILSGELKGKYFLLLGEKGTGKTSTVVESIKRVDGKDCVVVDCSTDVELMRLRIGTALNFEFFEDYIGSLFSMNGPRESTPILDIERAFIKLENILLERKKSTRKPLVLIFNNSHLIDTSLVQLLQQRAENFSSSGLLTMMFISDDYWLFEKMKTLSTRMQVINFEDTKLPEATKILKYARLKYFQKSLSDEECAQVYHMIGGRPQHLNHIASQEDMLLAAQELIDSEKRWFFNNCTLLGAEMDEDVVDFGKFATSAMLLVKELISIDNRIRNNKDNDQLDSSVLPSIPLWRAKQLMTRADFIEELDKKNIFTIGTNSTVKADSVPMMRAFHEIADHPDFEGVLQETIERIEEIGCVDRTREIVLKTVYHGGEIRLVKDPETGDTILKSEKKEKPKKIDWQDELIFSNFNLYSPGDEFKQSENKKWWNKRLSAFNHDTNNPTTQDTEPKEKSD